MTSQVLLLLLFVSLYTAYNVAAENTNYQRVCMQVESRDIDTLFGDNRDRVGPKGEQGEPGPRGSQGEVDYERVEEIVNRRVSEGLNALRDEMNKTMSQRIEKLEAELASLKNSLNGTGKPDYTWQPEYVDYTDDTVTTTTDAIETTQSTTTAPTTIPRTRPDNCDLEYNSKCFRAIVPGKSNFNFKASEKMCTDIGWGLANIYDETHLEKLMNYIRTMMPRRFIYVALWTGMRYKNNALYLTTGEQVTLDEESWYPYFPNSDAYYTHVLLDVTEFGGSEGIRNFPPTIPYYGIICEI